MTGKVNDQCRRCFHYGKSLVTSKTECVLADRYKVEPGDCGYFVDWEGRK